MKKLICLFLMLCLMAGCMRTSRHPQLVAVDSLLTSQPDSALMLLRQQLPSFGGTEGGGSIADRMYYYLLLADACNKCYDTLPSDSIMHEVADFYDAHGTPNEQVRAHYLLGCVYRDLGEAPQALDCYHTALDRADTTASDCNYRLLMSVYGQMADLFHRQNLPQDELHALDLSGKCFLACSDTIGYIRSQELKSKAYILMEDTASIIKNIEETQLLYIKHGYPYMAVRENGLLIDICVQRGELQKVTQLIKEYEGLSKLFDNSGNIEKGREVYYGIKGEYYLKSNQIDSAEYYMRKLLPYEYKSIAYEGLLSIYQKKGIKDSIVKYVRSYHSAIDQQNNRNRTQIVSQMSSMYNYHRLQIKAKQEEEKTNRIKQILWLVIIFVFVAIIIGIYIYHRYRRNKLKQIFQLHSNYIQARADYNTLKEELVLLQNDKQQLQEKKEQEITNLENIINGYKEKLLATNVIEYSSVDCNKELVNTFHHKAKGIKGVPLPSAKEWKELLRQFKKNTTIEQAVVCREGVLSHKERQVCVLLILEFTNSELSVLLNTTPQRITNIKSRINKKLFGDTSATTLQANIKYLSLDV